MAGFVSSESMARAGDEAVYDGAEASGSATQPLGVRQDTGAAEFEQAYQQPPLAPTEGFRTPGDAARHALARANPLSIRDNKEYGGLIYRRHHRVRRDTYAYTGPRKGVTGGFDNGDPHIRPPSEPRVQFVGAYHTHGANSARDPSTGEIFRTDVPQPGLDRWSPADLERQISEARGLPYERSGLQALQQRQRPSADEQRWRINYNYGVPPATEPLRYYLAGPGGTIREHIPDLPPSRSETAARDPDTGDVIPDGGTDRELPPPNRRNR